jgi:DNA repair protein RadC
VERLRERQQADKDLATFSDYEILQLLISYTGGEKSAKLAEKLLDTFGSLKGVLEARPEQLQMVKGIGARTASLIGMMIPMVRTWTRLCQQVPDRIGNSREAENYCLSLLAGERL